MDNRRYEEGMRIRREVLGEAHVSRAEAAKSEFDAPFQRFITETAWGTLWAGDGLDRPARSLITIAILAALGQRQHRGHARADPRGPAPRRRLRGCARRQQRDRPRQSHPCPAGP
jgi:4-carboxymuconolactone decarboxylase